MPRIIYNRKLNEKPKVFKFFTYWEFAALCIVIPIPIVITNMLGMSPTFTDSIVMIVLYVAFLLRFKIGRPDGYFSHWLTKFFTGRQFRPGHVDNSCPIDYPPEKSVTRRDLAKTQIAIYNRSGQLYIAPGKAIHYSALQDDVTEEIVRSLESGNPVSLDYYVPDTTIP